jgi:hypothetical protein
VIANNRRGGNWISIFRLCNECLSEVDESGEPNLMASDWSIWKEFIEAANHIKSSDERYVSELVFGKYQLPDSLQCPENRTGTSPETIQINKAAPHI